VAYATKGGDKMKQLTTALREYLKVRRSFGYRLLDTEKYLKNFIAFLVKRNCRFITVRLALQWATLPQYTTRACWTRRLSTVRLFARYRAAEDPRTEIPALHFLSGKPHRAIPYIYSNKELHQLLVAFQSLSSKGLRHHTYYTFFGLMIVTGCRISELLALNRDDLDLSNGWLTIWNSKFNKSRLLPLHPTTVEQLKKYSNVRDKFLGKNTSAFFISEAGTRLTTCGVRWVFVKVSKQIGLRAPDASNGPRIHDIRHRFATKTLLNWYRKGLDINQKISLLTTYLGHKKPSDIYWYVTGTPELLAQATTRFEKKLENKNENQ
jgi:integrase/recombinase XerD